MERIELYSYRREQDGTCEANGNHYKFGPEWPLKVSLLYLVSGPLDEDVEAPDDAGDGHQVEGDAAAELSSLQGTHVELLPLRQRLYLKRSELKKAAGVDEGLISERENSVTTIIFPLRPQKYFSARFQLTLQ